jgi:hypothetical protein
LFGLLNLFRELRADLFDLRCELCPGMFHLLGLFRELRTDLLDLFRKLCSDLLHLHCELRPDLLDLRYGERSRDAAGVWLLFGLLNVFFLPIVFGRFTMLELLNLRRSSDRDPSGLRATVRMQFMWCWPTRTRRGASTCFGAYHVRESCSERLSRRRTAADAGSDTAGCAAIYVPRNSKSGTGAGKRRADSAAHAAEGPWRGQLHQYWGSAAVEPPGSDRATQRRPGLDGCLQQASLGQNRRSHGVARAGDGRCFGLG